MANIKILGKEYHFVICFEICILVLPIETSWCFRPGAASGPHEAPSGRCFRMFVLAFWPLGTQWVDRSQPFPTFQQSFQRKIFSRLK